MEAARKVYHAELRAARRAKARAQNEPPRLTLGRRSSTLSATALADCWRWRPQYCCCCALTPA